MRDEFKQIHTTDGYINVNENELSDYALNHDKDLEDLTLRLVESDEIFALCAAVARFDDGSIIKKLNALKEFNKNELIEIITDKLRGFNG